MNGYHLNRSSSAVLSSSTMNITQFVTVVVTFVPVDEILWCDHSITSGTSSSNWYSCMVLLLVACSTMYVLRSSNFWVCGWNPLVLPFKWNLFSSTMYFGMIWFFIKQVCGQNPIVFTIHWQVNPLQPYFFHSTHLHVIIFSSGRN